MLKEFRGDWRIYRVCMSSNNPIETYHKIKTGYYSIITFLDMLEMLDVQDTIREDQAKRAEFEREKASKIKG